MYKTLETYQAVDTYVHLGPGGTSVPLLVTNTFWQQLASGGFGPLGPGRLVSTYEFSENWATWEKHPAGEEVGVLISGELNFILDLKDGERAIALNKPGQFILIPRDTWHTANVPKRAMVLFITAGEGTENRPRENSMKLKDGAFCKVIGGTHKGKSGTVRDIKTSKTGHVTITVVPKSGARFKTLAKNVVV